MSAKGDVALLDVNILIALFDPHHVHHDLAHDWFSEQRPRGWATCPLTENGFVRLLANPARGEAAMRSMEVIERLRVFCASGQHVFWTDDVSLRDTKLFNASLIRGHRQVADVYLLGLARKMGGRLATFDRSVPLAAVIGATLDTLVVISEASE